MGRCGRTAAVHVVEDVEELLGRHKTDRQLDAEFFEFEWESATLPASSSSHQVPERLRGASR